jgi:hypothetical protein
MNRSVRTLGVACACALASIGIGYLAQSIPAAQTPSRPDGAVVDPRETLIDDDSDALEEAALSPDDPDANVDIDALVDPATASSPDYTDVAVTAPLEAYQRADAAWFRKKATTADSASDETSVEPVPIENLADVGSALSLSSLASDASSFPNCIEQPVPSRRSASRGFNTLQLFQFSEDDLNTAVKRMVDSGSTVHRLTVYWADVQPAGPSTWNEDAWTRYHEIYDKLKACGFQVVLNPMGSPDWARIQLRQNGNPRAFPSDAWLGYWNVFVRELASRFDADSFEIWNEENSIEFWDPTPSHHPPSPTAWTNLFCRAAREIRSVRASAQVGVGGLAVNSQAGRNKIPAGQFLQRAYAAGLAKCDDSFVGYHPYMINAYCINGPNPPMQNTDAIAQFQRIRYWMGKYGQSALDVWISEWGFPSRTFVTSVKHHTSCRYTPQRQAAMIRREFNYLAQLAHLRFSVYFNIRDDGNAYPCGSSATGFSTIGMLPCSWTPAKPSFATWQSLP